MKKILFILSIILTLIAFSCTMGDEDNTPAEPTLANAAIFAVPATMTGANAARSADRAITASTNASIGSFYEYARDQVHFANEAAQSIKTLIADIEGSGAFGLESSIVAEDQTTGDRIAWTVGANNDYTLEWWRAQTGGTFLKLLELQLDEYVVSESSIAAQGYVIFFPGADADMLNDWHGHPGWIRVDFDSSNDAGLQYLKVQMEDFMAENLYYDLSDQPLKQRGILEAWKDSDGYVEVISSVRVPGFSDLNYELAGGSAAETETRYYIFSGRGNGSVATVSLAMPVGAYAETDNSVFDSDTIGDVISEHVADQLRADDWGPAGEGHTVLDILDAFDNAVDWGGSGTYSSSHPPTAEIASALETVYNGLADDHPNKEDIENILYFMSVENPAYFNESSFVSFGSTVPTGYPAAGDIPVMNLTNAMVDDLNLGFDSAGDIPPALTQ